MIKNALILIFLISTYTLIIERIITLFINKNRITRDRQNMEKTIKSLNIVAVALLIVNLCVELWDRFRPQKQTKDENETVDDEDGPEEEYDEEEIDK